MWGCVGVHGLYPKEGPLFRDEILNLDKFQASFHKVGRFDFVSMF